MKDSNYLFVCMLHCFICSILLQVKLFQKGPVSHITFLRFHNVTVELVMDAKCNSSVITAVHIYRKHQCSDWLCLNSTSSSPLKRLNSNMLASKSTINQLDSLCFPVAQQQCTNDFSHFNRRRDVCFLLLRSKAQTHKFHLNVSYFLPINRNITITGIFWNIRNVQIQY